MRTKSDLSDALYEELVIKGLTHMYGEFRYHINERLINEVWENESFEDLLNTGANMEWKVTCDKVGPRIYTFSVMHIIGIFTKTFVKDK